MMQRALGSPRQRASFVSSSIAATLHSVVTLASADRITEWLTSEHEAGQVLAASSTVPVMPISARKSAKQKRKPAVALAQHSRRRQGCMCTGANSLHREQDRRTLFGTYTWDTSRRALCAIGATSRGDHIRKFCELGIGTTAGRHG